ncbi:MAG: GH1 family beta-glucosidase [Alkalispirochaetaceae bacterium]
MVQFPENFIWGTATSAFQIEGAPEAEGKGLSIWDEFVRRPGAISDGSTPYPGPDHYRRWREDVDLMASLGVKAYRFSVSWPRVQPRGQGPVNRRGLDFYSRLVDALLERGIEPFLTLYHWDLPLGLQKRGGWERRETTDRFAEYAALLAERLGDRVRRWITINEPGTVTNFGYLRGVHAPGKRNLVAAARAVHFMLLAHGKAVRAIRAQRPEALVGLSSIVSPVVPEREKDRKIAALIDKGVNRLFLDPVFKGSYPRGLRMAMAMLTRETREEDLKTISEPIDFLGVNHYARTVVRKSRLPIIGFTVRAASYEGVRFTDMNWEVFPESFYDIISWVDREYGPIPIFVTENGAAFRDEVRSKEIDDRERIEYLRSYLTALNRAMREGVDVRGYFVWSLLDNFEWSEGLSKRFGLVHIDYATGRRTVKASGRWYSRVCHGDGTVFSSEQEERVLGENR